MAEDRKWRDAKLPQWVRDQIADEMRETQLQVALAWPTEANPTPVPFQWCAYDILKGTPEPGTYWRLSLDPVRIAMVNSRIRSWAFFGADNRELSVPRGPLYSSERDATLARLWVECRDAAKTLQNLRSKL